VGYRFDRIEVRIDAQRNPPFFITAALAIGVLQCPGCYNT